MDRPDEKPATPPVVAYKTLKNFLRGLSAAMPARIDKSVMTSMSGGTQSQLLHALKALGCISGPGVPTERLRRMVKTDTSEYSAALREAMQETYPFLPETDLSTVTMQQLREHFESMANGDTVRKCLTFFIPAAKDAGYTLSPYVREPGKRSSPNGSKPKSRTTRSALPKEPPPPQTDQREHHRKPSSWHQALLDKFPAFDPAWPEEVQKKWFESFANLMAKGGQE